MISPEVSGHLSDHRARLPENVRDRFVLLVGALFALPFIFFSLAGGYLADRYSKRSVTIGTKLFEIAVMIVALVALATGNLAMEAAAVFLISTQGALFGPSKYGLLPELLPEKDLSWGNGVIELGTFLAAIMATMAAGFLGRRISRPADLVRRDTAGLDTGGTSDEFWHFARACGRPSAPVPLESILRSRRTDSHYRAGSCSWLGCRRQHLFIFSSRTASICHRHLRPRRSARGRKANQLPSGSGGNRHWSGEPRSRLSLRGKIEYGLIPMGAIGMAVFGFLVSCTG